MPTSKEKYTRAFIANEARLCTGLLQILVGDQGGRIQVEIYLLHV